MKIKDRLWKGIVEYLCEDFISFFMPDLYPKINFGKGVEFLDKELESLFPKSEESKGYVDKLIKVFFKDGKETWIFIHVEIQGYKDEDFTKRMFKYFYRVFDKYQREITA
ncbi:MAG: Rpn family recombination-promoting nuclease/putative transposase [Candidatus Anammoxibacter sp.]